MAVYPSLDTIGYVEPMKQEMRWKTLISQFDELGQEKRKQKWLYPRRDITLKYDKITQAQISLLWAFHLARKGAYEAFSFFAPYSDAYLTEYVGIGTGSTTIFNLPSKQASSYVLYVNGIAQTGGGVDYAFSSGGGADGADKVTFTSAPANGAKITWSFTGTLKITCRFDSDTLDYDLFATLLAGTGVKLKGLLNA